MAQSRFSLSWDAYKKNVCNGLSSLQQNGEFVDMTLAADGHFVKVHQVILALASPYIKELLSTIQCTHPVLFLNKISYKTLTLVLEYIYTGEVLVSMENLGELLEAGRELHIKGLEDMKVHESLSTSNQVPDPEDAKEDEICYFEISDPHNMDKVSVNSTSLCGSMAKTIEYLEENVADAMEVMEEHSDSKEYVIGSKQVENSETAIGSTNSDAQNVTTMQYTISNQGSLQMILNRFVYYLKHTNRNNSRQWRCVDYVSNVKCPAHVVTKDNVVVQRIAAHTHPFHDRKILKKIRRGAIFSAIQDAEREGTHVRNKSSNAEMEDLGEE